MSFGTGHHETTQLMIDFLFEQNLVNKKFVTLDAELVFYQLLQKKLVQLRLMQLI